MSMSHSAIDLNCQFHIDEFDTIGQVYSCTVQINLGIKSQNVLIDKIHGTHIADMNNDNVLGLTAKDKGIQYLPMNLSEKFKNLIALRINLGKLKEIFKSDLEKFKKLRYLNLDLNDIEVLEENLFEFNTMLEVIWFEGNRIKIIDSEVFDNLLKLKDLDLNGNSCISNRVSNQYEIPSFIKTIKSQCFDSDQKIKDLKQKIEIFQVENSNLSLEIKKYEENLKNLNLENFDLRKKVESDKNLKNEISELNFQISNLKNEIKIKINEIFEESKKVEKYKNVLDQVIKKSSKSQEEVKKIKNIFEEMQNELRKLHEKIKNSEMNPKVSYLKQRTQEDKIFELIAQNSKMDENFEISNFTDQTQIEISSKIHLKNLEHEILKLMENLQMITKNNRKLQIDNDVFANKIVNLTQLISSMLVINDTNEDLRDKNAMLVSRMYESEFKSDIVLFIFVPFVVIMTLINITMIVKCYRKRDEIKCEHKNENDPLNMIKTDEFY